MCDLDDVDISVSILENFKNGLSFDMDQKDDDNWIQSSTKP